MSVRHDLDWTVVAGSGGARERKRDRAFADDVTRHVLVMQLIGLIRGQCHQDARMIGISGKVQNLSDCPSCQYDCGFGRSNLRACGCLHHPLPSLEHWLYKRVADAKRPPNCSNVN